MLIGASHVEELSARRDFTETCRRVYAATARIDDADLLASALKLGLTEAQAQAVMARERSRFLQGELTPKEERVEFDAWKDFAPKALGEPPWLVKPYIVEQGITLIAGEQKSGKTFLTGYFIGLLLQANRRVLLVEEEGSAVMVRQRLEPFIPLEADGLFIAFRKRHELTSGTGIERLTKIARQAGADVIALDPLIFLMEGDENDTGAMRTAMQGVLRLASDSGAAIVINHHARKAPSAGRGDLTSSDVRGNSTLMGAADVICLVQKREGEPGRVKFDVTCGDSRYEPFEKLECTVKLGLTGGMELASAKDVPEHLSQLAKDVYRLVPTDGSSRGVSTNQLAKALGRRKENVLQAAKELEDRGHISRHPDTLNLLRKRSDQRKSNNNAVPEALGLQQQNLNKIAVPENASREQGGNHPGTGSRNGSRQKKSSSHAVPNGNTPLDRAPPTEGSPQNSPSGGAHPPNGHGELILDMKPPAEEP